MFGFTFSSLWARKRRTIGAGIAVVIGVAFLASTMILGDAMTRGIDALFVEGYSGTDVEVRSSHQMDGEQLQYVSIPAGLADELAELPGVAAAVPVAEGTAQLTAADGSPIGGQGPPTIGTTWNDGDRNPYRIVEGRAPERAGEVVIDTGAAASGDLHVGDTTTVRLPQPVEVEIVGLAELGSGSDLGGVTFTWFDSVTAQRLLVGDTGDVTFVDLQAAPGVSPDQLRDEVARVLPPGTEARTGAELSAEALANLEADFLGFFKTFLLVFAVIAVLVACFSINNTFSILVAQRTRESALLRAVGASRRQVLASVAVEAAVIGIVASAIGLAVGFGLATGLNAVLGTMGAGMPTASLGLSTSVIVAALMTGTVTTLVAATAPAVRAARVAPLAALRDVAVDRSGTSRVRLVLGVLLAAGGAVGLVFATEQSNPLLVAGLGAIGVLVGAVLLGPILARVAAGVIGFPIARVRGVTGDLARRNASRNPKRTAGTASALMVGTAIVALFASLGSSIKASYTDLIAEQFGGDLVVRPEGFSGAGLPISLSADIGALPEVASVAPLRDVPVTIAGTDDWLLGSDMAAMSELAGLGDVEGDLATTGSGDLALGAAWAADHGIVLGSVVPVEFGDGAVEDLTVTAIYTADELMGSMLADTSVVDAHLTSPNDFLVLIGLADGVSLEQGRDAVASVTVDEGDPLVETSQDYLDAQGAQLDQMLGLVYGLLGVAVVIALIGIANTLSLSLLERTREVGILRAVGQTRRALRSTIRWESVIIALFGTVTGVALGTLACWGLVRAISVSEGFATFVPSYTTLGVILVVAAIAGVLAAARPARRAAKRDVLTAIATD